MNRFAVPGRLFYRLFLLVGCNFRRLFLNFAEKLFLMMIKSMTGFGKAETVTGNKKITVEIRSLNSKQLDLSVRMPSAWRESEYDIRNLAGKRLQRGKVEIFVTVESQAVDTSVKINRDIFKSYIQQINDALTFAGIDASYDTIATAAMRMPDVTTAADHTVDQSEREILVRTADAAISALDAFRTQEGATLIADILKRIDRIEEYRNAVVPFEKARTETIRNRIRENIAAIGVDVDPNRLEQEMIFYIEKLDITEEKVRLTNHCKYFREVAAGEEGAGRKLGFIAQELGREINTMGSKANDTDIQILVVKMKDELEKIKEQLLNIL